MLKRAVNFQGFSKLANATVVCRLSSIGLLNWLSCTNLMIVIYKEKQKNSMFALSDLVLICLS